MFGRLGGGAIASPVGDGGITWESGSPVWCHGSTRCIKLKVTEPVSMCQSFGGLRPNSGSFASGRVGVGVKSYFVFLRYLIWLNLLHCALVGGFIVGPTAFHLGDRGMGKSAAATIKSRSNMISVSLNVSSLQFLQNC